MTQSTNESICLSDISLVETSFIHGELNVPGLVGILVFYAAIFGVGIYASWRGRKKVVQSRTEDVMLAGRDMNEVIGVLTITATWVGGDYINGTAEFLVTPGYGVVWCLAPLLFSLAFIFNGVVFAKKMWNAGYVTMLDPFEIKYGKVQTALLYVAALFAEVAFASIAFAVLGATLTVIVGISYLWAVIFSALVALLYTVVGGLSSVAYTDVVQLASIFFGLILAIPFAMNHPAVTDISITAKGENSWLGEFPEGPAIGMYVDTALLFFFGAVPWQIYYQRALSQKTAQKAMVLSIIAAFVTILCSLPAFVVGAIAASTDWNATGYRDIGTIPMPACDYPLALPLVMRFLTPVTVGVIGLGAVSGAVMSSSDSCILSSSSMFSHNVYTPLRNAISKTFFDGSVASDRELVWVLRGAMVVVALVTTLIAITVKSILALVMISVDIPYCILFPQLMCVMYLPSTNTYGSFVGLLMGTFIRFAAGEHFLHIPPLIKYPWYDEELQMQLFPFKTLTTIIHFMFIVMVSLLTRELATCCQWFRRMDNRLFQCFVQDSAKLYEEKEIEVLNPSVTKQKVPEPDTDTPMLAPENEPNAEETDNVCEI